MEERGVRSGADRSKLIRLVVKHLHCASCTTAQPQCSHAETIRSECAFMSVSSAPPRRGGPLMQRCQLELGRVILHLAPRSRTQHTVWKGHRCYYSQNVLYDATNRTIDFVHLALDNALWTPLPGSILLRCYARVALTL